ncbi:MAG: succinate dehydrogenase assembly factor 2 [Pseudomonadota bacterium]
MTDSSDPKNTSVNPHESLEDRRKRLLYRAKYRGFREADFLIGGFAAENVPTMTVAELDEFEELLAMSDHDLYNWASGRTEPPANVSGPVFERLCAFDVSKLTAPE